MIIAFTGHRDKMCADGQLGMVEFMYPGATWIHGGAEGFDSQVNQYAEAHGIPCKAVRPKYALFPPSHRNRAPIARNYDMVDVADVVVVLWDGRETGGTFDTARYAAGLKRPMHYLKVAP